MLTTVPFFKGNQIDISIISELVVSSFECEKCGYKNNEVQTTG